VEAVQLQVEAVQLEMESVLLEMESAHPPCAGDGTAGPGFTLGSHLPQVVLKKQKNKIRKKTLVCHQVCP
jgi:hypothetical protein